MKRRWRRRRRSWLRSDRADGRGARPWHWSTDRESSPPRTEVNWPEDRRGWLPGRPATTRDEGQSRIDSRLVDHPAVLEPRQVPAIEVIPAADHDLDAILLERIKGQPGIRERGDGRVQHQELFGLAPFDGPRHDPVRGRVERDR